MCGPRYDGGLLPPTSVSARHFSIRQFFVLEQRIYLHSPQTYTWAYKEAYVSEI